ncbi:MAG: CopG family transcriptional regulator [Saprospiraceae bacterium]|nr:CopG family transcriptional regulator [Saprospiraceae bacterium]
MADYTSIRKNVKKLVIIKKAIEISQDMDYNVDSYPHKHRCTMKTIQITIDDALLLEVDRATHRKKIARSQFIRKALEETLRQMAVEELEQKQAEGYRRQPVTPGEFDIWQSEQAWG